MARRKRELLDILRNSASSDGPGSSSITPNPASPSASVPSKPDPAPAVKPPQRKAKPTRRPSEPRPTKVSNPQRLKWQVGVVGLLALVLISVKLWPTGPAEAAQGDTSTDSVAVTVSEPYSVLVATYKFKPEIQAIAIETARALRSQIPNHAVELTVFPAEAPENIELWIGASTTTDDLQALLRQVQESSVPTDKKNPRPFASARIERRKPLTSN